MAWEPPNSATFQSGRGQGIAGFQEVSVWPVIVLAMAPYCSLPDDRYRPVRPVALDHCFRVMIKMRSGSSGVRVTAPHLAYGHDTPVQTAGSARSAESADATILVTARSQCYEILEKSWRQKINAATTPASRPVASDILPTICMCLFLCCAA